jgi:hypothetical protein
VLPSGEVAFTGHDRGGATVTAPVLSAMAVKPSTETPTLTTAAWMTVVCVVGTTSDTASVSDVCCSSLRLADSRRRRAVPNADGAAVPVTGICVLAKESVRHTTVADWMVLMEAIATLVPVTYSGSMLIVGTHMSGITTTNSYRVSALRLVTLKAYFPFSPRRTPTTALFTHCSVPSHRAQ